MTKKIEFKTEKRKISELKGCDYNPRQLTKKQYSDLKKSIIKFNYAEIALINTDNTIVAGHQRLKILEEIKGADYVVDVRVPNREFTKEEFDEYLIRSNKNTGEWDWDMLANNFDTGNLKAWGFEDSEFGFTAHDQDKYTEKIETPTYNPTMVVKPGLDTLCATEKRDVLVEKINRSKIPKKERDFLILAAERHLMFDYELIAEYYAHSNNEVQSLMEDLSLVIIDFNKAIEQGYVTMNESILAQYENDNAE